jgi:3-isopropylmalate/(R)-2-methylmalate dehydratase small subunit
MSFEKFENLKSPAIALPIENIDTDQIIPARFLKAVERKGFGDNLFRDWRYEKTDQENKKFVLNDKKYSGSILLAGKNFGSGSSREHAAWALYDYGFRVIVSSYFADIFKNNALNNGLLPIQVTSGDFEELISAVNENPNTIFEVDLEQQSLRVPERHFELSFEINTYKKECLLNGYDDFTYLQNMLADIEKYEQERAAAF